MNILKFTLMAVFSILMLWIAVQLPLNMRGGWGAVFLSILLIPTSIDQGVDRLTVYLWTH